MMRQENNRFLFPDLRLSVFSRSLEVDTMSKVVVSIALVEGEMLSDRAARSV